jgi:DNA-directed RNA polymerase subunit RPC12/RpoP
MITYCSACGKKIEHKALEKPNFCPKCGFSFLKGGQTPPPAKPDIETTEPEESLGVEINLTELDFDVEYDMSTKGQSMGSIIDQSGNTAPQNRKNPRGKKLSKKQRTANSKNFLDGFKKESGTSR